MLLSRSELENLTRTYNRWHISIYLPTHRAGAETAQDSIRLKNLLREAEERLIDVGASHNQVEELLGSARSLLNNELFWQHQSNGLVLFLAENFSRYYQLPLSFEELVVVGDHFHIKPLLPVISSNGQFYLLTLDQQEIHLYQGTRHTISEIQLEEIPDELAEIMKWDDPEQRLQLHTGSGTAMQGGVPAIFHGHGVASEDDPKDYIRRYFQRINEAVSQWLGGEAAPLVLAGVEYLLPLYQDANSYPHLIEEGIQSDPQSLDHRELHARAWDLVEPHFQAERQQAENSYHHLAENEQQRTSDHLEEIVPASFHQRIVSLFAAVEVHCWGKFDPDSGAVDLHKEEELMDTDLLDLAAAHTLVNGGHVYALDQEDIPAGGPAAAIFRY